MERISLLKVQHYRFVEMERRIKAPKKIIYWENGQPLHVKKNCKYGEANSANGSKDHVTNMVVFEKEDDELSI